MTDARLRRQQALSGLLRRSRHSRQDELVGELRALGHVVTQATVSRDLDQLGAIKIRQGGETRYALPGAIGAAPASEARMKSLFAEWVRAVVPAASLVVLKTPPGSAHLVGVALDAADLPEVVGTVSGDDTLFVATISAEQAAELAALWRSWIGT